MKRDSNIHNLIANFGEGMTKLNEKVTQKNKNKVIIEGEEQKENNNEEEEKKENELNGNPINFHKKVDNIENKIETNTNYTYSKKNPKKKKK